MVQSANRPPRPPAPSKIKILEVADELFYSDGIHTVGVDRIIATAHVTKATFYKHYRSKDILIVAYVRGRDSATRARMAKLRTELSDPNEILRAIAQAIVEDATRLGFHGCPYINAAAQFSDPEHPVRIAVSEHRTWYREFLIKLFTESGASRPEVSADDVLLARDGALGGGNVSDPVAAGAALKRAVERIIATA